MSINPKVTNLQILLAQYSSAVITAYVTNEAKFITDRDSIYAEVLAAIADLLTTSQPASPATIGYGGKYGHRFGATPLEDSLPIHPDDIAVEQFAEAMKSELAAKRKQGRGGWADQLQCPTKTLQADLAAHVLKGNPIDVGNFAMMLWMRGESTSGG